MAPFRARARKGQAISIDAAFASLLVLSAVFICIQASSAAAGGLAYSSDSALMLSRAVSAADFIVKEGAAFKENSSWGTVARAGEIDPGLLFALDYTSLAERVGAGMVCSEIVRPGDGGREAGDGSCRSGACVLRPAYLHEGKEAAYVRVCIE